MANSIRINDLANPVLSELQQSILDYGKTLEVSLDPTRIMAEARQQLSLAD